MHHRPPPLDTSQRHEYCSEMSEEKVRRLSDHDLDYRIPARRRLAVGEVIEGTVVSIGQSHVFVDVGSKSEALLDLAEVVDEKGEAQVKLGDKVQAYVVALEPEVTLSYALARKQLNLQALEDAKEMGIPVEGRVAGVNKGGLEIDFHGARAFCPISQIELGFCEDASAHVGKSYDFRVLEFAEGGRKLVVSRRALLEEERREAEEALRAELQEGAEFEGEVKSLHPYGAFVDIGGGIEGMVHVSEIGHSRIEHPQEALRVGQRVRVKVLRVERDPKHPDRQRIALSMRALLGDPWQAAGMLQEGDEVDGRVVRLQPFGAFVEISPGVDGLIHVSELSDARVGHPGDVVSVGQAVKATVLKVDVAQKRISLSLRGRRAEVSEALAVGNVVECVVDRIKPFGLLVRIKGGPRNARGLIPVEETGGGRNANLRRSFPEGTELKAMVIAVEPDSGKLRLSLKAQAEQEERAELGKLMADGGGAAATSAPASLGTLGDLLKRAMHKDAK
jgi:small subunit ribosomal protein S1